MPRLWFSVLAMLIASGLASSADAQTRFQGGQGATSTQSRTNTNFGQSNLGIGNAGDTSNNGLSNRFQAEFDRFTTGSAGVVGTGQAAAGFGAATINSGNAMNPGMGGLGGFGAMSPLGGMGLGGMGLGGFGGTGFGGLGGMGFGGMGGMGFGGMGGFGRGGFNNQFNRGMGNQNAQGQTQIRATLRVGFETPVPAPAVVSSRLTERLAGIDQIEATGPVVVVMEGRTAILQGSVATEHDRQLAARLVALEPGVSVVRNELVVGPAAAIPVPAGTP